MAVKFPLKMSDGTLVKTIEELRDHFNFIDVLGYYSNGRLIKWLEDRFYDEEAEKVKTLDSKSESLKKDLCGILGIEYLEAEADKIDLNDVLKKNERLERLRVYTADDKILAAVDKVAFTQEELDNLLDKDIKEIYLCGQRFQIPEKQESVMFIGINNPTIYAPENFLEKRIVFDGVKLNGVNDIVWRAERSTDQAEAFKLWSAAAEQGNAEAQYRLGICYYNGKGVNQDYVEALKWIRKAAGKNHAKVFTHNGYSYMDFQKCIATNPIIALKKDGTVVENMEIPTQNWKNVIAVFSGDRVIAGLKSNGTVVTVKHTYRNIAQTLIFPGDETQCGTQDWRDIINLSVKDEFIVGVKSDGRVVTNKEIYNGQCDVRNWRDIVAVSIGNDYIIGLKKDGTVVVAGDNHYRQCAIQNWRDIVAVSTGRYHTIGLKKDGTVIVAGLQDGTDENDDNDLLCSVHVNRDVVKKVQNWNDIIAISFDGRSIIVGLKKDGTVVSADISPHLGTMQEDQCNVRNWRDIVAVSTGNGCTVGLKRDGTICVTPNGNTTQYCSNWSNIGLVLNELEVTEDTIASGQTLSIAQT